MELNPTAQIYAGKNPDGAIFGEAPTLAIMRKAYGEGFPASWLMPQIFDLVVYSNSRGTLNEQQAEFLAEAIANEYFYLKASELLLFFYRFKLGRYGHFYGVVDPMKVTQALAEFVRERNAAIDAKRQKEEKEEREKSAENAISLREYCRQNGIPETDNILDAIANVKPPTDYEPNS